MATEVESRYVVPDRVLFRKLLQLRRIDQYTLDPLGPIKVVDRYLDTKGRALLRQGWACRLRAEGERWIATLKGPKSLQGAIVSRQELEVTLRRREADPAHWPHGELRDRVRELAGGLPLRELLTIRQLRHRFTLLVDGVPLALLTLDVVLIVAGGQHHRSFMLECELTDPTALGVLQRLDTFLVNDYYLIPEGRSKLQRALEFAEAGSISDDREARPRPPMTLDALCERYDVALAQACHVADLADALYERLASLHQLPEARRALLRTAALLHNVGGALDRAEREIVSRDILLGQPIVGLSEEERRIVAAVSFLHRKKATSGRIKEAFPKPLEAQVRHEALLMAALVRLASALDAAGTQDTNLVGVEQSGRTVHISVRGQAAAQDARRAQARSDLWAMLLDSTLIWQAESPVPAQTEGVQAPKKEVLGLAPTDTMRDAARKVLAYHLERMLQHEPGTRLGEDPEELHDMRVATRRLRSALRLFRADLSGERLGLNMGGLGRVAEVLGNVRDLDVAIARAEGFAEGMHSAERSALGPLLAAWHAAREEMRKQMLAYLESQSYREVVEGLQGMIAELVPEAASSSHGHPVSEVVPKLLHVRWQMVCAYGAVIKDAPIELLHALRIDCKHLRYALEFYSELLAPAVVEAIPEVIALQDHLGALHDADVAIAMLDRFTAQQASLSAITTEAIGLYRRDRQDELKRLLQGVPEVWRRFMHQRVQRRLALILA